MGLTILLVSIIDKFRSFQERPLERLQEIGVKERMTFLDVGCTLGFYSFPASVLVGDSGLVYALDVNSKCLEWIEKKASQRGISNIKTVKADACRTGLSDESVDIVFLHLVFHALKDKHVAIKEFYQVLRSDGKLVIDEKNVMPLEGIINLAEEGGFKFSIRLFKTVQIFKKHSAQM